MKPRHLPRRGPGPRVLVILLLAFAGLPAGSPAQTDGRTLAERELAYRAAIQVYEAAVAARQVVENRWRTALDSVTAARLGGDRERLDRASAAFLNQTAEFERLDARVRATEDSLATAREDFLDGLDQRVAELVEEADTATTDAQSAEILSLARDLQNQYRAVLSEEADALTPTPVFYPGILAYDPRDTPDLIRGKAQLVERRIQAVEAQLGEARESIERIVGLIRLRRQQENFNAPLDRFGDAQVPVVSGGGAGQGQQQGDPGTRDSTGSRPPTLEEQLEVWRLQEEQLGLLLAQLEQNLERFRARIGADPAGASGLRGGGA